MIETLGTTPGCEVCVAQLAQALALPEAGIAGKICKIDYFIKATVNRIGRAAKSRDYDRGHNPPFKDDFSKDALHSGRPPTMPEKEVTNSIERVKKRPGSSRNEYYSA